MALETVLMYNCGGDEWSTLRQIFLMLGVRIQAVEAEQYGLPLEALLVHSPDRAPVSEEFSDPMLVFCAMERDRLDQLLSAMHRAQLPRIHLKAMLTPTNRAWTSQQLWTELRREHQAMAAALEQRRRQGQKPAHRKKKR